MNTSVNQKGGYHKTLTITQNHSNEAQCMLKEQFLKKTQNYIIQIGDFYTSSASYINTFEDEFHFRIRPLNPAADFSIREFPDGWSEPDYTFSGTFYTVTEFVRALQYFFISSGFYTSRWASLAR